jgi:hypothetical protein
MMLDFSGCINLERLPEQLPNSLTTLDCNHCYNLERLPERLPNSLTTLDCI